MCVICSILDSTKRLRLNLCLSQDPKPGLISVEMQFDICQELYREGVTSGCAYALDRLEKCLSAINTFLDFLQLGHKRIDLHKMFELINGKIISSRTAIPDADILDFGLPPTTTTHTVSFQIFRSLSFISFFFCEKLYLRIFS